MRAPVQRRAACSITVGHVDLLLESAVGDWRLECSRCPWETSAHGFGEAVEWARGHSATHDRWRRLVGWVVRW